MILAEVELKRARAERFKAEAKKPIPPVPRNRIAWSGGKLVTSDKEEVLLKFIQRKLAAGSELTAEQARAMSLLRPANLETENLPLNPNGGIPPRRTLLSATDSVSRETCNSSREHANHATRPQVTKPMQTPTVDAEVRKILKKLRECDALNQKLIAGVQLEANQIAKINTTRTLEIRLDELRQSANATMGLVECNKISYHHICSD